MSYGLDIWRPGKVLNLQWTEGDQGVAEIISFSFRRGTWEEEVMGLR